MKLAWRTAWCLAVVLAVAECKSATDCPKCTCEAGAVAAAEPAAPGTTPQAGAAAVVPAAASESPAATENRKAAQRCAGPDCAEPAPDEQPTGTGVSGPGPERPAAGTPPAVAVQPAVDAVEPPAPAEPLAPGLAAHLTRLPGDADVTLVVQADVRALLSAEALRAALGPVLDMLRGEVPGDPSCLAELAAAVDLLTVGYFDSVDGPETGAVILEGGLDLPGIAECAARVAPDELPQDIGAQAAKGMIVLDDDFVVATLGPRTVAFGESGLIARMRAGRMSHPLSGSHEFEAARRAAGAGPAYVVAMARSTREGDSDESFSGGAALRTTPRLGAAGVFTFATMDMVGEVVGDYTEAMGDMSRDRGEMLAGLGRLPGMQTLIGDLTRLSDAALDARLTVRGKTLSFEVWAPEGMNAEQLASMLARATPLLLLDKQSEAAPQLVESATAVPAPPEPPEPPAAAPAGRRPQHAAQAPTQPLL